MLRSLKKGFKLLKSEQMDLSGKPFDMINSIKISPTIFQQSQNFHTQLRNASFSYNKRGFSTSFPVVSHATEELYGIKTSTSSTNFNYGFPTPGPQNPTPKSVMDHVFFVSQTQWKKVREEMKFDYVVVGIVFQKNILA